jgi:hypothetical protein
MAVSTLFVFGAGASRFSGACIPQPPPLGHELFAALAMRPGVAASLDGDLADAFGKDFETGMALFRERDDTRTTRFLREMAAYFAQFTVGPNNLYIQLLSALNECRCRPVLATLNYDLLIEIAVGRVGKRVSYTTTAAKRDNMSVLKVHGSCNFIPELGGAEVKGIGFNLSGAPLASIIDAPIRIVDSDEVMQFCTGDGSTAPALALYTRGKAVLYCASFVRRQQLEYEAASARARRIYVIGVHVNETDSHIWAPLASASAPLFYVGPDAAAFLEWAGQHRRRRAHHLATSFETAIPNIVRHHGGKAGMA